MVIQGISLFASALWQIHNRLRGSGVPRKYRFDAVHSPVVEICVGGSHGLSLPPRRLLVSSSTDGFLFVWRDSSLSKDSFGVGLTTCCRALKLKCVCIHQREENTTVIVWKAVSFHGFFGRTWCKGTLKNLHQSSDFGHVTNLSSGHVVARCFMSGHSYLKKIQVQDFLRKQVGNPHDAGEFHPANIYIKRTCNRR